MPATAKCLVRGSISELHGNREKLKLTTQDVDEFFDLPHIVRPGETISSTGLTKRAGGKGANQAYALAKAGASVVLDGNVGSDGVWVKDMLAENGVDVSRVGVVSEEVSIKSNKDQKLGADVQVTGRALIQRAADGENSIGELRLFHKHKPS